MTTRVSFEPKDPRIIFDDYWYSSDDEDASETVVVDGKPRKRKTGTQALVEFLNNTSPEEFQTPKRAPSFFRRRKNNLTNQTHPPPHIVRRKNYIEIIANPLKEAMKSTTSSSSFSHEIVGRGYNDSIHANNANANHSGMVLPLPYHSSVKREPSVYSLQRSIHPRCEQPARTPASDADAIIEQALLQRLEQSYQQNNETPGEVITKLLAAEHLHALNILTEQEKIKEEEKKTTNKKRTRHVQVQTLSLNEKDSDKFNANVSAPSSIMDSNENLLKRLEIAEQELKKERRTRQKLEATLLESSEHFEVLSGLAYIKLRELWEEKLHWENAYLDIKRQSCQRQSLGDEVATSDEGLSLDESYLD